MLDGLRWKLKTILNLFQSLNLGNSQTPNFYEKGLIKALYSLLDWKLVYKIKLFEKFDISTLNWRSIK